MNASRYRVFCEYFLFDKFYNLYLGKRIVLVRPKEKICFLAIVTNFIKIKAVTFSKFKVQIFKIVDDVNVQKNFFHDNTYKKNHVIPFL
jgi:hypothetical protein